MSIVRTVVYVCVKYFVFTFISIRTRLILAIVINGLVFFSPDKRFVARKCLARVRRTSSRTTPRPSSLTTSPFGNNLNTVPTSCTCAARHDGIARPDKIDKDESHTDPVQLWRRRRARTDGRRAPAHSRQKGREIHNTLNKIYMRIYVTAATVI